MTDAKPHRWQFAARFRRNAFDWRSQPAIARIGGVADQCVLELVQSVGREAAHIEQLGIGESAQMALQFIFVQRMDCVQQFVGELAADYRADLDNFLGRTEQFRPRAPATVKWRRRSNSK
jgi:hypothetical protein